MKNPAKMSNDFDKMLLFSRRGFMQGAVALGSAAMLAGCSKDDSDTVIVPGGESDTTPVEPTAPVERFYGSSGHNCGGRCITRAEVSKGKIQRFLTDESKYTTDGLYLDPESRNFPQTRSCARCRGYRYRLYHTGRLLYPLKQTKKRGDLTGFERITWEQALTEIAAKHKKVVDKYTVDGIYSIYAWGAATGAFQGASGGPLGAGGAGGAGGAALRYMGGAQSSFFGSYSTHQYRYFGTYYTGIDEGSYAFDGVANANSIAKYTNTVIHWGNNAPSTANPVSYSHIRGAEDMKKRDPNAKIYFVGPEFVDGGVTIADEWVVSKPYTDPALIAGMLYHMLDNTFNLTDGSLKSNPWLDIDYLDTMVYGFFDSPAYSITQATGAIDATVAQTGDRFVSAVPPGRSYCSWLLGDNANAKTYGALGASTNYTAKQFAAGADMPRWATCSYSAASSTQYKTKQDFKTPKTPAWASAITGVPVLKIEELAERFIKNAPVLSTWSGGQQKQADGIANLYAVEALQIITKNAGATGAGFKWSNYMGPSIVKDPMITPTAGSGYQGIGANPPRTSDAAYLAQGKTYMVNKQKAAASCTAWHTAIKMCYMDELKQGGYTAKYVPNWDISGARTGDGNVYWDDGGTKTFVTWKRNDDGTIKTYSDGTGTYYDWEGRTGADGSPAAHTGTPRIAGIRLMYNSGGNIFLNQHENVNDSRDMLECLPLNNGDADTFCLVSFDNFMAPSPRWSDYVLPAATSWEQQDIMAPSCGNNFYIPQVITPPGESKPTWDFANDLLKTFEKIEPKAAGAATDFTGTIPNQTVEAIIKKQFQTVALIPVSQLYGKTWDEYVKNPIVPVKFDDFKDPSMGTKPAMDGYKQHVADGKLLSDPYIKTSAWGSDYANCIRTNDALDDKPADNGTGYGNQYAITTDAPMASMRYQVYSPVLTWQYVNKFSKWHGWLYGKTDAQGNSLMGQQHKDIEGDRIVIEIPVYYAYEDYFMEAYGFTSQSQLTGAGLTYLLTTTHDRYRSHSSMAENPLMRELTHRVPGQDSKDHYKQGNDYGDYAMPPSQAFAVNGSGTYPVLNRTINPDGTVDTANKDIASYTEIWMNKAEGETMGLKDGDLVQVENPIGAVRCVARLTMRCAKGFVGLHQGCWFDPREIGGKTVDVGGCCNSLMASQPSRIDHGNGQQSAMVKINKVTE